MKRYAYFFVFIIGFIAIYNKAHGQCYNFVTADPAPGSTVQEQELNTYWHYRYRLTHYFMVMGSKVGMSIPADVRNGWWDAAPTSDMYWVDGGRLLGWYLCMLATEYKLLELNGQNTDENVTELYYALHAVFRLDSVYIDNWSALSNYFAPPFTYPATFPGEGFMPLDDISYPSSIYYTNWPWGPFAPNGSLNQGLLTPSAKLSTAGNYTTVAYNSDNYPVAESGDGKVGPVTDAKAGTGNWMDLMSTDNYLAILMGLSMVNQLVDDPNVGFPGCSNPYNYGLTPHQMAHELGQTIINYIGYYSNWNLIKPDGTNAGGIGGYWWFGPFSVPVASLMGPFSALCLPPSSADVYAWNNYTTSEATYICGGIQNLEMGIECAAMTNLQGGYSSACSMIGAFGQNSTAGNCTSLSDFTTTCTGWDLCYQAILQLLTGETCSPSLCDMQAIIDCAPYHGPFCHGIYDHAGGLWASSRRFMLDYYRDGNGNQGECGNYNGLDYMVFFNLYCLMANFPQPNLSRSYPYNILSNVFGTTANPQYLSYPCSDVTIEQLDVHNLSTSTYGYAGDVNIQVGNTNYVHLMPQTDNYIHVENGGYFYAACPLTCVNTCGNPSGTFYSWQPDPDPSQTSGADQRIGSSYQKTPEFDTAYSTNAFNSFPNPFTTTTTIDFTLLNDEPVSLYIMGTTGQIIQKLIDNETYTKGGHIVNYNGSSLAAGTYIAVLLTKEGKKTVKMIKTK